MSRFISDRMAGVKAYVPGEQPKGEVLLKLNTNESPYPPSPRVREAVANSVAGLNRYSDIDCTGLGSAFCRVFGTKENNLLFTNGSDEALYYCFMAFCDGERGIVFPDITYGFYSVYADVCGVKARKIPLGEDFSVDIEDYFGVGATVLIANPNAPTGLALTASQVEKIVINNPDNVVIIDEAYTEFSDTTSRHLVDKYDNLVIVGTFSKSRYLAGARLGYIIADESLIADINKVKFSVNPYNVNTLTQAAGVAALEDNGYYVNLCAEICRVRDGFARALTEIGFEVIHSECNFVFARHPDFDGEYITNQLKSRGILIRHFSGKRTSPYIRVTIGTQENMEKVLSAIKQIIGGE